MQILPIHANLIVHELQASEFILWIPGSLSLSIVMRENQLALEYRLHFSWAVYWISALSAAEFWIEVDDNADPELPVWF